MDILTNIPPALIMFIGALSLLGLQKKRRRREYAIVVVATPLLALAYSWLLISNYLAPMTVEVAGFSLYLVKVHPYTPVFATIFCLIAAIGGIYALGSKKLNPLEMVAAYLYAGSALGVTFAGDFLTFFIYWEVMAIGSALVVWCGNSEAAARSGLRYVYMHFLGGVILMAGIASHLGLNPDSTLRPFEADLDIWLHLQTLDRHGMAMWCILIGILINAAAIPFSAWLPDAYPESTPAGGVFLSAFTTKTAVFALLTLFPGNPILVPVGLVMVFYGIIYALLENDIRRILSYSIINQVGFMVTAIGIGTTMALHGAAMHAFAHIIYKGLLFMSAGSVIAMTGKHKCNELGGLYRSMPITTICGLIGALSISAFPLTSGFVTKSIISDAAAKEGLLVIWLLLAAASAGVFLHAGIKFPWFVFFQKDSGLRPKDPPKFMRIAMIIAAALCILPAIPGVAEYTLYKLLPSQPDYKSYTLSHVITQLQLLLFSGLAFFLLLPMLKRTKTISLDIDWFYRVPAVYLLRKLEKLFGKANRVLEWVVVRASRKMLKAIRHTHGYEGVMARSWPMGITALWIVGILGGYLLVYYYY